MGVARATNEIETCVSYKVEKRTSPTVSLWTWQGTANKVHGIVSGYPEAGTTVTSTFTNDKGGHMRWSNSGTGFTAGTHYMAHWTADAEL
jgi:hypothetical protein